MEFQNLRYAHIAELLIYSSIGLMKGEEDLVLEEVEGVELA
jgi:hypothetical protein